MGNTGSVQFPSFPMPTCDHDHAVEDKVWDLTPTTAEKPCLQRWLPTEFAKMVQNENYNDYTPTKEIS